MTLNHTLVRALLKNFPHIERKYTSLPELSKDIETIRESEIFFIRLAQGDSILVNEVEELMNTWRRDLNQQMCQMIEDTKQKRLNV